VKICLISPPYNSAVRSVVGVSSPPIGLAYLASVLRGEHEVKIVDHAVRNNLLVTWDWTKYTGLEPVMQIKGLSGKKLKSLLQEAYLKFYLTPKTLWSWLRNGQLIFIKSALKAVINYLKLGWIAKWVEC